MDMTSKHILIVEDDASLAQWIADYLMSQHFQITVADRGDKAVELIRLHSPDLVLLDINLPGKDGFEVCKEVRKEFDNPILMMTARDEELDEVLGLELGADDYIIKPVRARALMARIKSLLKKVPPFSAAKSVSDTLVFDSLIIDFNSRSAQVDGISLLLSTAEFDVLWLLAKQAGNVVSRDELTKEIRGIEYDGLDRSTDILVSRLRRKLAKFNSQKDRIKTVWGKGYLFLPQAK